MAHGPLLVFTRFEAPSGGRLAPWREHNRLVSGGPVVAPAQSTGERAVVWYLAAPNYRMLARTALVFETLDAAVDNAKQLVSLSECIEVQFVSGVSRRGFGWFGRVDGEPAITCARWYPTEREQRHSVSLALAALAGAELRPGARSIPPLSPLPAR